MLAATSVFFEGGDKFSDARVWVQAKYGSSLPLAHVARISQIPGIATGEADYGVGTGGFYQNPEQPRRTGGRLAGTSRRKWIPPAASCGNRKSFAPIRKIAPAR